MSTYLNPHSLQGFDEAADGTVLTKQGTDLVFQQNGGGSLSALTDVSVDSPENGDFLLYSDSDSDWENVTPSIVEISEGNGNRNYYPDALQDGDGNYYGATIIGDQVWMTENLKTTSYSDGNALPESDYSNYESSDGSFTFPSSSTDFVEEYGCLYNGYALLDGGGTKKSALSLLPQGWKIPTEDDLEDLKETLTGQSPKAQQIFYTNELYSYLMPKYAGGVTYSGGQYHVDHYFNERMFLGSSTKVATKASPSLVYVMQFEDCSEQVGGGEIARMDLRQAPIEDFYSVRGLYDGTPEEFIEEYNRTHGIDTTPKADGKFLKNLGGNQLAWSDISYNDLKERPFGEFCNDVTRMIKLTDSDEGYNGQNPSGGVYGKQAYLNTEEGLPKKVVINNEIEIELDSYDNEILTFGDAVYLGDIFRNGSTVNTSTGDGYGVIFYDGNIIILFTENRFGTTTPTLGAVYSECSVKTIDNMYIDFSGFRSEFSNVAFTGSYNDLNNKPTLLTTPDWDEGDSDATDYVKNRTHYRTFNTNSVMFGMNPYDGTSMEGQNYNYLWYFALNEKPVIDTNQTDWVISLTTPTYSVTRENVTLSRYNSDTFYYDIYDSNQQPIINIAIYAQYGGSIKMHLYENANIIQNPGDIPLAGITLSIYRSSLLNPAEEYTYNKLGFEYLPLPNPANANPGLVVGVANGEYTLLDNTTSSIYPVSYLQLRNKITNSTLVPGAMYRITDYVTTTKNGTSPDISNSSVLYKSAGKQFDLIVTATSTNTLDCCAKAMLHSGDNYFSASGNKCDLSKWQIWYDVNNDDSKYEWADTTNGKGVIYRMIDEFGNDCPYDFKNIQFKRKLTSGVYDVTGGTDTWVYTFNAWNSDDSVIEDASVIAGRDSIDDGTNLCYGNTMKFYCQNTRSDNISLILNDNVFLNTYSINGGDYFFCYGNTFGDGCHGNTFGGFYCYGNTFGDYCTDNTFGSSCHCNTFGNQCYNNTFGDGFFYSTFRNQCYNNTFGDGCHYNTLGDGCYSNIFGNYCESNTFGNGCTNIIFSNGSGNYGDYVRYVIVENGCSFIRLYRSVTANNSNYLQNIHITQGVAGTLANYLEISTIERNLSYMTTVGKETDGTIRIYNEHNESNSFTHSPNTTVVGNTATVSLTGAEKCSAMFTISDDVALTINCENNSDNYIWLKNTSASSVDVTISSVNKNNTAVTNVYIPLDGFSIPAGQVCEIGLIVNSDGAFITSRNDLTL